MLNNASGFDHVYLAVDYTDLRRGIDGLVGIIRESFRLDPYENSLFLFCGKRSDRIVKNVAVYYGPVWPGNAACWPPKVAICA